ncbi:MAG: 50S ribosomal protein L35 [Dehalococcoidales bacterium]|jgi:large subunit ribosomal protein L35|nr:50S ribosomal protein L35 [Dehalococcoidales bacterium]
MLKKYKMKTHKGAKDRFMATGTGKVLRTKGGKSHLRRNRSKMAKGLYDEMIPASHAEKDRLKALLPYGAKYIR